MGLRSFNRSSFASSAVRQGAGLLGRGHWAAGLLLLAVGAAAVFFGKDEAGQAATAPRAGHHAPLPGNAADLPGHGTVTHCFDGDSFRMTTAMGEQEVRLWGVDAPEHGQPYGEDARAFAKRHWEGKEVEVVSDHGQDRYGRKIVEMRLKEGPVIQKLLLDNGYAWYYRQYAPGRADFASAEAAARARKAGLWAGRDPVPPGDWRRAHPR